jgi:hypothetical protein
MSALGTLRSNPKTIPIIQPGQGNWTQPMTRPIPNRLMNAASSAVVLSGNCIGSIIATVTAPKITPLISPPVRFAMAMIPARRTRPRQSQRRVNLLLRRNSSVALGENGGHAGTLNEINQKELH